MQKTILDLCSEVWRTIQTKRLRIFIVDLIDHSKGKEITPHPSTTNLIGSKTQGKQVCCLITAKGSSIDQTKYAKFIRPRIGSTYPLAKAADIRGIVSTKIIIDLVGHSEKDLKMSLQLIINLD